jgi:hypothetical protein
LSKWLKIHSADFGDIRLLAGFGITGPVHENFFSMLADAARGKKNFRVHPLQSWLANAPKSANCHVHFISAIFFDPADHCLTIFQKN